MRSLYHQFQPGRVESIFFFLVVPGQGRDNTVAKWQADLQCQSSCNKSASNGRGERWFVRSLQDLVNAHRLCLGVSPGLRLGTQCPPDSPAVALAGWIESFCAAPQAKVGREGGITTWVEQFCAPRRVGTSGGVNRHTDNARWADYFVVHRSVSVRSAQGLWNELHTLSRCRRGYAKLTFDNNVWVVKDCAESEATDSKGSCLQPQGGAVALLGACFGEEGPEPPHLRMVESPKAWTRAQRWLWAVGECPPVYDRCGNPRLEQRDVPLSTRDDAPIFFDIAGREATVGRSAVVMLDARPLEEDPEPSRPQLQAKLLYNYLHTHLADTLMVAFTQRHVLYELSTEMARTGLSDDLDDLVQRIFDFRRIWWWEHLHRHPTSRAFTAFQQYWRLPSLMAQLATEVTDYYQREQQRAASRLNRYGALIAVLATFFGLLQVSGVSKLHGIYLEVGLLGVAVTISFGTLLWGLGRVRRRRRSAHGGMGGE